MSKERENTSATDEALAKATRGIELIREYRTGLIADAVTGKLDVRQAADGPLPRPGTREARAPYCLPPSG